MKNKNIILNFILATSLILTHLSIFISPVLAGNTTPITIPALSIFNDGQYIIGQELIDLRTRTSKTTYLGKTPDGRERYAIDASIGSIHYKDDPDDSLEQWKEIETNIVPSDNPLWDWEVVKGNWHLLIKNDTTVALGKDGNWLGFRYEGFAYFDTAAQLYQILDNRREVTPVVSGNSIRWENIFYGANLEYIYGADGFKENLEVTQEARNWLANNPPSSYGLSNQTSYLVGYIECDLQSAYPTEDEDGNTISLDNYETEGEAIFWRDPIKDRIVSALPTGYAIHEDLQPNEWAKIRHRFYLHDNGKHYLLFGAKVTTLNQYPAGTIILDPTIDEQVGASGDDGYIWGASSSANTTSSNYVGASASYVYNSWYTWDNITIPQYSEIQSANISLYNYSSQGSPLTKIYFEDTNAPAQIVSHADYDSRDAIGSGTDWDGVLSAGWNESPDAASDIQTLVNKYNFSSASIQCLHKDDGSPQDGNNYQYARSWDYDVHALGAKLSIVYEVPSGPPTVVTNASSNTTISSSILNAEITNVGTGNATARRFQWGVLSGNYTDNWTESGNYGVGVFSHEITGLDGDTTYYFVASANNTEGWGTGSELSFKTRSPSLYFTSSELDTMKSLKAEPSHSTMWSNIETWANDHVDDEPPVETTAEATSYTIMHYIDNMVFMYYMTDNTTYADAAVNWMYHISDNWSTWGADITTSRPVAFGVANGYYSLRNYMDSGNRTTIAARMTDNVSTTYDYYLSYVEVPGTLNSGAFLTRMFTIGTFVGIGALGLGDDNPDYDDWIYFSKQFVNEGLDRGAGADGSWIEGTAYGIRQGAYTRLVRYIDALKRVYDYDMYADYSDHFANIAYYFLYSLIEDDGTGDPTCLQLEDSTGGAAYTFPDETGLSFLYRVADEYSDNYSQDMANDYAEQDYALSYIWKDSALTPVQTTGLPLYRDFSDAGYITWRSGWDTDDLLFWFKSGASLGHAHSTQNTFLIYKGGRPLTCSTGYASSWVEYKPSQFGNCITTGNYTGSESEVVFGRGQAHEPSSYVGPDVAMYVRGSINASVLDNSYYMYVRGDASPLYNNDIAETEYADWVLFSSGNLTTWDRHIVFIPDQEYFVIYDYVELPLVERINWYYNARDIYNEKTGDDPPDLTIDTGLITHLLPGDANQPDARRLEIEMLSPAPTDLSSEIRSAAGIYGAEFSYILVWPTVNVDEQNFVSVMTVDDKLSSGNLTTELVEQSNCIGTIVSYNGTNNKDLLLFSDNGSSVSEWIELGGSYQAADSENYTFDGSTVQVVFDTYSVMRLQEGGIIAPTVTTANATSVLSTTATMNGNITSINGQNADFRGVEWGLVSANYTDNQTSAGSFGTGAFTEDITGLLANTTYYYRGMAHNDGDWGYGDEISFTTEEEEEEAAAESGWLALLRVINVIVGVSIIIVTISVFAKDPVSALIMILVGIVGIVFVNQIIAGL